MEPTRRRNGFSSCSVAVVALVWFSAGASDEAQVRAVVHQVAEGAEEADLNHTMEPFSDHYADEDGAER